MVSTVILHSYISFSIWHFIYFLIQSSQIKPKRSIRWKWQASTKRSGARSKIGRQSSAVRNCKYQKFQINRVVMNFNIFFGEKWYLHLRQQGLVIAAVFKFFDGSRKASAHGAKIEYCWVDSSLWLITPSTFSGEISKMTFIDYRHSLW